MFDDKTPFDEDFLDEDLLDDVSPDEVFLVESDDALLLKFAGTPWEAPLRQVAQNNSWDDRIKLYQAFRAENVLPSHATYFLIAWAIQASAGARIDELYTTMYESRMAAIRAEHGLDEDDEWEPGCGPAEYEALDAEYDQACQAIVRAAYQKYGEHKILELLEKNPEEADRRYGAGYDAMYALIDEDLLKSVSEEMNK